MKQQVVASPMQLWRIMKESMAVWNVFHRTSQLYLCRGGPLAGCTKQPPGVDVLFEMMREILGQTNTTCMAVQSIAWSNITDGAGLYIMSVAHSKRLNSQSLHLDTATLAT